LQVRNLLQQQRYQCNTGCRSRQSGGELQLSWRAWIESCDWQHNTTHPSTIRRASAQQFGPVRKWFEKPLPCWVLARMRRNVRVSTRMPNAAMASIVHKLGPWASMADIRFWTVVRVPPPEMGRSRKLLSMRANRATVRGTDR
jgi:hypothetical protein